MKIDKLENYIIAFILFLFFIINIYQLTNQHWSSIMDMDSAVIYNSLLLASGQEQEFRDHPAFTLFLLLYLTNFNLSAASSSSTTI